MLQGIQPVLVGAGGDDLAVEFGRGVEVMVVVIESGLAQLRGMFPAQHTQRRTGLHAQRAHLADHLSHNLKVAVAWFAPGRTHAEARRAAGARRARRGHHRFHFHQLLVPHVGGIDRRLGTIAAILGTAASLDRQQCGQLQGIGVKMLAMHLLGAINQVGEGQLE